MGMLVNGVWQDDVDVPTDKQGNFIRTSSSFRNQIIHPEPNRYHLYISHACPWATRASIMRSLKKLENIISMSVTDAFMGNLGWSFGQSGKETLDQVNHAHHLKDIYLLADKNYTGRVTVPVLWDKITKTIVNNESAEIMRMLNKEFNVFTTVNTDYYPENLKNDIDAINEFVYDNINNGVYKCGFAKTQQAYDEAIDRLFAGLDKIETLLSKQRYLVGKLLTEADLRLFTTLIRFDIVYVGHFKCNLRRISDYPHLSNYLRELYQIPEIKKTLDFEHIKKHYYQSQLKINPTGIVPKGPEIDFEKPHNRNFS